MIYIFIVIAGLCVAYANGANDNFKGVATLFGSGTTNYRRALWWATAATLLGSIAAFLMAGNLIKSFGGKGLVEDAIVIQPAFAASVGLGTALTIFIATRIGMPVSTTHGLIGSLIGTGLIASSNLNLGNLVWKFVIPLLLSPILAVAITSLIYPALRFLRIRMGITRDDCICVGKETVEVLPTDCQAAAMERVEFYSAKLGKVATCQSRYQGGVMGVSAAGMLDRTHYLSAGILSFARGLNDTPKIAALLLLAPVMNVGFSLVLIGVVIAIGGLFSARKVAETMSHRITTMNHGQGTTANIISGTIVIGASYLGMPVSTTHVSCGSLFGIGAVTGGARKNTIITILLSWVITLPMAAVSACVCFSILRLI
ncbi:MAG: anion permease [Mariniblastus sp.]